MSVLVASLNSGSNGNCYYVGHADAGILIDAGISCRETEKRLKRLGLSVRKIKAIFITHEHGDHIHGVGALSRKYKLPVYLSKETYHHGFLDLKNEFVHFIQPFEFIPVEDFIITPLPKQHDAADPCSFSVERAGVVVGVFTDLGKPCEHTIEWFQKCHAAFLESNYDESMLENGSYPPLLKQRIRGDFGHLSNEQALQLFVNHRPAFMSHLFLSHLSRENNSPKLVRELFELHAGPTTIVVASRTRETKLYHIRKNAPGRANSIATREETQLSLF